MIKPLVKTTLFVLFCFLFIGCDKDTDTLPSPPIAIAGNSQTIQLPASSFTLTGSGTTQNGNITGYLWSLVSGPNVPVITRPSSASTTVTNIVAGTYIFQFMVIDNAGLTGIDTVTVTLTAGAIQTLTLQPTNNSDERHILGNATMDMSNHAT